MATVLQRDGGKEIDEVEETGRKRKLSKDGGIDEKRQKERNKEK